MSMQQQFTDEHKNESVNFTFQGNIPRLQGGSGADPGISEGSWLNLRVLLDGCVWEGFARKFLLKLDIWCMKKCFLLQIHKDVCTIFEAHLPAVRAVS